MKHAPLIDTLEEKHGSLQTYVLGFIMSILLTLAAYYLVVGHFLTDWVLDYAIVSLSVVQILVQLLFFLHLGNEPKPYWNLLVFLFMVLVVAIIVIGSLWIMYELDYRTMASMRSVEFKPS